MVTPLEKSAVKDVLFIMDRDEFIAMLRRTYQQQLTGGKRRRIVFWFDQGKEFMQQIETIVIADVKIHILSTENSFLLKYLLEEKDTASDFLIYCDYALFWHFVSEKRYGSHDYSKLHMALYIYLAISALNRSSEVKFLTTAVDDASPLHNTTDSLNYTGHWMHHETDYLAYDKLAESIESEIKPAVLKPNPQLDARAEDSFPYFDKMIILNIANNLEKNLEDYTDYIKLINFRRIKYFHRKNYNIYEALFNTVKIFEFFKKYKLVAQQNQPVPLYRAYIEDRNNMDFYYRRFYAAFDKETNSGMMNKLKSMIENLSRLIKIQQDKAGINHPVVEYSMRWTGPEDK